YERRDDRGDSRPPREGGFQKRPYQPRDDRGDSRPPREGGFERRPYERRDDRGPDRGRPARAEGSWRGRDEAEVYVPPPGLAAKADEPATPEGLDLRQLPRAVRAELRGLTSELADIVGAHLLMAGQLIDTDPALAYRHAEAARRRAARLPVTREAAGEAAYAAGEYAAALTEFRALRRMNGGDEFVAAMADCERALGNPDKALALVKEGLKAQPEFTARVELRLVEAGARMDLGQADEALRVLRQELENGGGRGTRSSRIRLRYGYANLLEATGATADAERWFAAAAGMDVEGETDAAERVQALQGLVIDIDEDDLVGDDDVETAAEDSDESDAGDSADSDDDAQDGSDDGAEDSDESDASDDEDAADSGESLDREAVDDTLTDEGSDRDARDGVHQGDEDDSEDGHADPDELDADLGGERIDGPEG
ncbi:MAG TPA: hypothetical protein PKG79_07010, partial [Propioniciclava tarda]|nr:hypothetical protein [Propioniciclava tarda]